MAKTSKNIGPSSDTKGKKQAGPKGRNLLLAFGIDKYPHFTHLNNARRDVEAIANLLGQRYDFQVNKENLLFDENATRTRILKALRLFCNLEVAKPEDRLLIYYSGHGFFDKLTQSGFWVPFDALNGEVEDYVPSSRVREIISHIPCRHILLVSDSCFSSSLLVRGGKNLEGAFEEWENNKSRWVFSSGKGIVLDGKPGENSPFSGAILKTLSENKEPLNIGLLADKVTKLVKFNYEQQAEAAPLHAAGHDGGQFVFRLKANEEEEYRAALAGELNDLDRFLEKFPDSRFAPGIAFERAKRLNSFPEFRQFRKRFPGSAFDAQAKELGRLAEEDAMFKHCKTSADYEDYLDTYEEGTGRYRQLAEEAIERLEKKLTLKAQPIIPTRLLFEPEMVFIKGGTFQMGSEEEEDEKPIHPVTVGDFYLGKYQVTIGEFAHFVKDRDFKTDADKDGGSFRWNGKEWEKMPGVNWKCDCEGIVRPEKDWNHPVIHVSWNDVTEYSKWLSRKTSKTYRLPTEAEWEYAAGNGSKHTRYSWGDGPPVGKKGGNVADEAAKRKFPDWTIFDGYDDGYVFTAPVGQFDPNEFGLHDMTGNVWEWCRDWYGPYLSGAQKDPTGPDKEGDNRVVRGGGWGFNAENCRVSYRGNGAPASRDYNLGFRLVLQL